MSRVIKFRVWDTQEKKYYCPFYDASNGRLEELLIGLNGDLLLRNFVGIKHESVFPDRFILEQFTGRLDKNGKDEVCAGDTIHAIIKGESVATIGDVVWDNENSCYGSKNDAGITPLYKLYNIKVIGNIHEEASDEE